MPNAAAPDPKGDPEAALSDAERAELDAAAVATPGDTARAQQGWRTDAPPPLRTLLDAPPETA